MWNVRRVDRYILSFCNLSTSEGLTSLSIRPFLEDLCIYLSTSPGICLVGSICSDSNSNNDGRPTFMNKWKLLGRSVNSVLYLQSRRVIVFFNMNKGSCSDQFLFMEAIEPKQTHELLLRECRYSYEIIAPIL